MPSLVASNGDDDGRDGNLLLARAALSSSGLRSGVRMRLLGVHVGPIYP